MTSLGGHGDKFSAAAEANSYLGWAVWEPPGAGLKVLAEKFGGVRTHKEVVTSGVGHKKKEGMAVVSNLLVQSAPCLLSIVELQGRVYSKLWC